MKKVLLVEDDKFLVRIYAVRLKALGIQTIILADGSQVLETVKKEKPNVVILDMIMPVKDGFEVLKELKNVSEAKNVPVVVLTNLKNETFERIGVKPEKYITKSEVSFEKVLEEIKDYLV